MTDLTRRDLPAIDNKEAFQVDNLTFILSAIGWRWDFFGLPLNIGTPK